MAQLAQKGSSAPLDDKALQGLKVVAKWGIAADFDIAAIYKGKDGKTGIVYFGDAGKVQEFPFIKHSGDEGVGDKVEASGKNQETLKIAQIPTEMATIHLIIWDYEKVKKGEKARFEGSDLSIELTDSSGHTDTVKAEAGTMGNVVVLATIDNTNPVGAKLINTSKGGTLKGLNDDKDLWAVAETV